MKEFLNTELFDLGQGPVSMLDILSSGAIVMISLFLLYIFSQSLKHRHAKLLLKSRPRKRLRRLLLSSVLLVDTFIILGIAGWGSKQLAKVYLINADPVTLSVFHIFIILLAVLIVQFFVLILRRLFDAIIHSKSMDVGIGLAIYQIVKYTIWVIVIILLLDAVGVQITLLLAGAGALLIGLGFGIQQIFSDVVSGILLLFERNLKVEDIVEVDGVVGRVQHIGLRTSRVITRDNIEIIIPNTKFIADNVINWSHMEKATRFHVKVGVAYGSDVRLVEKLLLESARNHPDILTGPTPLVFFKDFGDSSLDFEVYFWTHQAFRFEKIRSDLRFAIDKAFRENGVTIPFPQRDVHFYPTQ